HLRVHDGRPSIETMGEFQKLVQKHLEELADEGYTVLPKVEIEQAIHYLKVRERLTGRRNTKADLRVIENFSGGRWKQVPDCLSAIHVTSELGLIAVMGQLLATVGKLICRCPHCGKIFLQSRRNQEYCDRKCQSVSVMQRKRAMLIKGKELNHSGRKRGG